MPGMPTKNSSPAQPGRGGPAGEHRAAATAPPARTVPGVGRSSVDRRSNSPVEHDGHAGEARRRPRAGSSPGRRRGPAGGARRTTRGDGARASALAATRTSDGDRATDAVGGELGERDVALDRGRAGTASQLARRPRSRAAVRRAAARRVAPATRRATVVRSPAPSVRTRSPGRAQPRHVRDEVGPARAGRRPAASGCASSTACRTSRPETPGLGRLARGVDVGEDDARRRRRTRRRSRATARAVRV